MRSQAITNLGHSGIDFADSDSIAEAMTLSGTQVRYEMTASASASSVHVTGGFQIGTPISSVTYTTSPTVAYSLVLQISSGDTLTLNTATGAVTGTVSGVYQVETATVTAASGCTSNGTANIVVTGANLTGSPITVPVALTTATHTTAALIAGAIRTALAANAVIAAEYTVGGASATVTLTDLTYRVNDATLNIAIPGGLGITAAASSVDTTAGVAESKAYRISGQTWDQKDFEGVALPTMTAVCSTAMTCSSASASVLIEYDTDKVVEMVSPFVSVQSSTAAAHPFGAGTVDFTATGNLVIYLDIHAI